MHLDCWHCRTGWNTLIYSKMCVHVRGEKKMEARVAEEKEEYLLFRGESVMESSMTA